MSTTLKSFAVHLFTQVRIKVVGVQAESSAEAMQKADNAVNFHALFDHPHFRAATSGGMQIEAIAWAEDVTACALVDPLTDVGEVDDDHSEWLDGNANPLIDGKTPEERKAASCDKADAFFQELLGSVETLSGIAEEHGVRTLADLMYLQTAIMKDSFIDHYPDESKVLDIALALPSGEQWAKFIKVEYLASPVPEAA